MRNPLNTFLHDVKVSPSLEQRYVAGFRS